MAEPTNWQDAGADGDAGPGSCRVVSVDGVAVAVFRTPDGWIALEDRCPHAGAPLSEGVWRDGHVVCAWHGWRFDGRTGACPLFPGAPAATARPVRVEGGRVLVGPRGG